ncbi:JDVT-CTERM system glutamic-type intramembrane protease [Aquabacterium sp. NJ1]|uniref:JDVT-CTERM system glutamic-type intramembrane protease MrtJ n=1 Tax=Aquabacterium sp. NJ1 TaxID=1538295 RepID=UPI00068E7904|nr:JDVT-CTERM system glutamic-type intramembrane protease [Aquabacterium sp. NJ1]
MSDSAWRAWLGDPLFVAALMLAIPVWVLASWLHIHAAPAGSDAGVLLSVAVIQPVCEELLFRGVIQGALRRRFPGFHMGSLSGANVITALLFAAAHLWRQPPWLAGAVLVPGLIYGCQRDRWGSIWPGALLHVCHNAGLLATGYL